MQMARETFTGYEVDLITLWITRAVDSSDPDVIQLLASLDGERYQLYKEMRDRSRCSKVCEAPVY
jgi:hypothetical protein